MNGSNTLRITLLSHFAGGNHGDAALLHSAIQHIRVVLPHAEITSVTFDPGATRNLHGIEGRKICASSIPFYGPAQDMVADDAALRLDTSFRGRVRRLFPRLYGALRSGQRKLLLVAREPAHWVEAYRYMRQARVLLMPGSAQLTQQFGGPWGHPYALYKWTLAARLAGARVVFLSVGVGKLPSALGRYFIRAALRRADHVSVRESRSQKYLADVLGVESQEAPDLAFGLDVSGYVPAIPGQIGTEIIGFSPISYARQGLWPEPDAAIASRYFDLVLGFAEYLIRQGKTLRVFTSDGPDQVVALELEAALRQRLPVSLHGAIQLVLPRTAGELLSVLEKTDLVFTSRFHGCILAQRLGKPVLALYPDHRLATHIRMAGQAHVSADIHEATLQDLQQRFELLEHDRDALSQSLATVFEPWKLAVRDQFQTLATIATQE